jgi:hypothetical protein
MNINQLGDRGNRIRQVLAQRGRWSGLAICPAAQPDRPVDARSARRTTCSFHDFARILACNPVDS